EKYALVLQAFGTRYQSLLSQEGAIAVPMARSRSRQNQRLASRPDLPAYYEDLTATQDCSRCLGVSTSRPGCGFLRHWEGAFLRGRFRVWQGRVPARARAENSVLTWG